MLTGILKRLSLTILLLAAAGVLHAASITNVERGVHDGFELVILNCDTLPDFSLQYDQVQGIFQLQLKQGRISSSAFKALYAFGSRETIAGVTVDRKTGVIAFRVKGLVYLRQHIVSGPPALILDFSAEPEHPGRYPFELDRGQYLKLGGRAEREGKLSLALNYVERVRSWNDDDANLIHRSGVIEQRLGQWDVALETFAKTAADPSLAADAHARRTMIYMAKGDTLASGQEWAGYFHKKAHAVEHDTLPDTIAVQVAAVARSVQPADTPFQQLNKRLPKVLQAGGGDGSTYLYYGWGMLAVGLVTLIGLWAGSSKSRHLAAAEAEIYHPMAPPEALSEYEFLRALKAKDDRTPPRPPMPMMTFSEPARAPISDPPARYEVTEPPPAPVDPRPAQHEGISSRVVSAYQGAPPRRVPNPIPPSTGKIPIEQIIQLADEGFKQAEIAHKLSVGRDEVAMVINLARLSRHREARRDV